MLWSVLSLVQRFLALDAMARMCSLKESFWSKRTPRNLPEVWNGIGVLWQMIGDAVSSVLDWRGRGLKIISKDLLSLIPILRSPQKAIT